MCSHNGNPVLVHRQRGTKVFFHQALQDRKLLAIPGIHYFDAHRLRAHLLQASELQLNPRTSNITGPEGAGDAVEDLSSDEERDTRMLRPMLKRLWRKSLGVRLSRTRQMTRKRDRRSRQQAGNHDEWVSTAGEYFLPARQPRRPSGFVVAGEIDYLVDFHPR